MVLYAVVETVRKILLEIVFQTVLRAVVWTALRIACQTISETVF
jgi:hypothetical protein